MAAGNAEYCLLYLRSSKLVSGTSDEHDGNLDIRQVVRWRGLLPVNTAIAGLRCPEPVGTGSSVVKLCHGRGDDDLAAAHPDGGRGWTSQSSETRGDAHDDNGPQTINHGSVSGRKGAQTEKPEALGYY